MLGRTLEKSPPSGTRLWQLITKYVPSKRCYRPLKAETRVRIPLGPPLLTHTPLLPGAVIVPLHASTTAARLRRRPSVKRTRGVSEVLRRKVLVPIRGDAP